MKHVVRSMVFVGGIVVAAGLAFFAPTPGSEVHAQNVSRFTTPSGRFYNPYAHGPFGSYTQGIGNAFSAGSPSRFTVGPPQPAPYGTWPPLSPNLYNNPRYGGTFYYQPMVGPQYDPFRNGR
jgi:hypothetical protein